MALVIIKPEARCLCQKASRKGTSINKDFAPK